MMKHAIKTTLRKFGYALTPLRSVGGAYPQVKRYTPADQSFDFWLADEQAAFWYDHDQMGANLEAATLSRMVRPGDRVLEIGCHHGFYTMLLAQLVGAEGWVLALDALGRNVMIAQAQAGLNELGQRCRILHRAGAAQKGMLRMEAPDGSNARAGACSSQAAFEVQAVTGDELDQTCGPFDVLKLDVEGFEGQVLQGCQQLLQRRVRIALELHLALLGRHDCSPQDVFETIGVENYHGEMFAGNMTAPEPFDPDRLPESHGVMIYLWPK